MLVKYLTRNSQTQRKCIHHLKQVRKEYQDDVLDEDYVTVLLGDGLLVVEHGGELLVDLLLLFELFGGRGGYKRGELDLLCDTEVF
jgi:hypothetical protein